MVRFLRLLISNCPSSTNVFGLAFTLLFKSKVADEMLIIFLRFCASPSFSMISSHLFVGNSESSLKILVMLSDFFRSSHLGCMFNRAMPKDNSEIGSRKTKRWMMGSQNSSSSLAQFSSQCIFEDPTAIITNFDVEAPHVRNQSHLVEFVARNPQA
jgi:hypothetical protein